MTSLQRTSTALLGLTLLASCSFHSTATHWNGRIGARGEPIFVKTSTNVAFNLLVILPFLGRVSMDEMVDGTSLAIAEDGGDRLRVIQSGSENYWYGFPPFTWIVTPVITDVAIEYEPSKEQFETLRAEKGASE